MNVLLLVADSLRADRLSLFGCPRPTSPFVDSLAVRGVAFERAWTPVAPTRPAIATMLSGQMPWTHGVVGKRWPRRPSSAMASMPEAFARAGYDTLVVDSLAGRRCSPWLRRGFTKSVALGGDGSRPRAQDFNRIALEWLRARSGRPSFVVLRYCETHTPYLPPRRLRSLFYEGDPTTRNAGSLASFWERPHRAYFFEEWERPLREEWPGAKGARLEDLDFIRAMYDSSVRALDEGIAELLEELARRGTLDDTLIVLTADHGESLGEHGVYFAHVGLHETVLRVPCVIAGAGVGARGRRVREPITIADLAPTILELAGLAAPARLDGRSLAPLLQARSATTPLSRPASALACEATYRAAWSLRTGRHKVIASRLPAVAPEVYDLVEDPAETRDLASEQPELRDTLLAALEETLATELSACGARVDPVVAALPHVHGATASKTIWRLARRTLRHAVKRVCGSASQPWLNRNGSSRPVATAQPM